MARGSPARLQISNPRGGGRGGCCTRYITHIAAGYEENPMYAREFMTTLY